MPGLFGVVQRDNGARLRDVFDRQTRRMEATSGVELETAIDAAGEWAIGRAHFGVLNPAPQLDAAAAIHVLFHGDLHNEAELRNRAGLAGDGTRAGISRLVAALYARSGSACAAQMKGAFCAVIVDQQARRVVLVNDLVSTYPVYWAHAGQRFLFGPSLGSALCDSSLATSLNPRAIADLLSLGFVAGDKTIAAGVQLLPPWASLTFSWDEGTVAIERHQRLADVFRPQRWTKPDYERAVVDAFAGAVGRAFDGPSRFGLSLSGGLDSRAILSALNGRAHLVTTRTLGVRGCADQVIAARLADIAGTAHRFDELEIPDGGSFLDFFRRVVNLGDGMFVSHGLTESVALRTLENPDFSILVRGHGGELAKSSRGWPFHTDARTARIRVPAELVDYLLQRTGYVTGGLSIRELLSPEWFARIDGGGRASLEESIAGVELGADDLCSYLYLHEIHRRYTVASLQLFRHYVDVRLPFLDAEFLAVLFSGPPSWRRDTDLHRAIIALLRPELLKMRNSNTGAGAGAGPWTEAVGETLTAVFRRLNIAGYRHYHSFDAWMRDRFLASVEELLLRRASIVTGIVQEHTLRRVIADTRRGAADYGFLLKVLLMLELWHRQLNDDAAGDCELPAVAVAQ